MADPKYANLPGIDTQPDVYETSDLPEDDQQQEVDELKSESVEHFNVNANTAFSKFKDKKLLDGNVDFSDRVSHSRRTGYFVPRTEYEILEEGTEIKETPVQKYQRLQHEIRELSDEVEQLKQAAEDSKSPSVTPVSLMQQLSGLQEQLYGLHLEKILGSDAMLEAADPQGTLPKKLLSQLEAFKNLSVQSAGKSPAKPDPQNQDGCITYELHYSPEQAKFAQLSKASELEQRLAKLEDIIGQDSQKFSFLTADTSSKCLMDAAVQLQAQIGLLDPLQLDHADARIQGLLQHLNQVKEKKKTAEDAGKESKISELYDMVEKWDGIADTVPAIVERLQALKDLHEQALQFSQALSHLDTTQQQLTSALNNQDTLLKELKQSFATNMTSIQANCHSLEERMKKFQK
ncbi:dynactin subunit 2-like [Acanthaster planci]|uniref:Dynactin subunit 2-like n=1 Tax=Acanthaster planci TaxID=133434 RepID=A0A8B7XIZ5_ACAPL|nr:dynactin subunit 2-like [Acanthaster planci]